MVAAATCLAVAVVTGVTWPENRRASRMAPALGVDPGWTPWLLPVVVLASTVAAIVVVGHLLRIAFLRVGDPARPPGVGLTRVVVAASVVWTVAVAARICLTASEVFGRPVREAVTARNMRFLLADLPSGRALVAALLLTVAVAVLSSRVRTANGAAGVLVLALVALMPPVATGHASSGAGHQVIISALLLHIAAAVLWTGGLTALVVGPRDRGGELVTAVRRFSGLALVCFATVVVTGLLGAASRLSTLEELVGTTYGLVLTAKVVALVILGVAGAVHRGASIPRLVAGRRGAFARLAGVEVLVMAATMGLAVALARTPPPTDFGVAVLETPFAPAMRWLPEPVFLAAMIAAVAAYAMAVRRLRGLGQTWPLRRLLAWTGGWVALVGAATTQLAVVNPRATDVVSTAQHFTAAVVAPALIVAGAPLTLATAAGPAGGGMGERVVAVARGLLGWFSARLGPGLLLYAAALYAVALTAVNDWSTRYHGVHLLIYGVAVAAGALASCLSGRTAMLPAGTSRPRLLTVVGATTLLQIVFTLALIEAGAGALPIVGAILFLVAVAGAATARVVTAPA